MQLQEISSGRREQGFNSLLYQVHDVLVIRGDTCSDTRHQLIKCNLIDLCHIQRTFIVVYYESILVSNFLFLMSELPNCIKEHWLKH